MSYNTGMSKILPLTAERNEREASEKKVMLELELEAKGKHSQNNVLSAPNPKDGKFCS